jgi:hypothetical protein
LRGVDGGASLTRVRGTNGFEVNGWTGDVSGGNLVRFTVTVSVWRVEERRGMGLERTEP